MKNWPIVAFALLALVISVQPALTESTGRYVVVGTGQTRCYNNFREIRCPRKGQPFYGQDAQYPGKKPAYQDNGDGTITDLNTGLMWVKARGPKGNFETAVEGASKCRVGGYKDWRMPTIKELYSLINFSGGFHPEGKSVPYLETAYFDFKYGNVSLGERPIDCQDWSANEYVGSTGLPPAAFGVNFADGRIKAYPQKILGPAIGRPGMRSGLSFRHGMRPGPPPSFHARRGGPPRPRYDMRPRPPFRHGGRPSGRYFRYVRGNTSYGINHFVDNGDGTVTDKATGLMWAKADSGRGMNWEAALNWVQEKNTEKYLGYSDWRLPNAKELQSIVDYSRSPSASDKARKGPAIDPVFQITELTNGDYPSFWTSTTHLDGPIDRMGRNAVYVAFGKALGYMRIPPHTPPRLVDIHGAGAQRSDPKVGNPSDFPYGRGPQGDVIGINNFVRCVRTAKLCPDESWWCQDRSWLNHLIIHLSLITHALTGT